MMENETWIQCRSLSVSRCSISSTRKLAEYTVSIEYCPFRCTTGSSGATAHIATPPQHGRGFCPYITSMERPALSDAPDTDQLVCGEHDDSWSSPSEGTSGPVNNWNRQLAPPTPPAPGQPTLGPVPVFLDRTYAIVDKGSDDVVAWSESGDSFVIRKVETFAKMLLPTLFNHNNFESCVRQLNFYGEWAHVSLSILSVVELNMTSNPASVPMP